MIVAKYTAPADLNALGEIFGVMKCPARLRILQMVAIRQSMSQGDILDRLDMTASTLSVHLRHMVAVGFLTQSPQGQTRVYELAELGSHALSTFPEFLEKASH